MHIYGAAGVRNKPHTPTTSNRMGLKELTIHHVSGCSQSSIIQAGMAHAWGGIMA
jgi:hypothetical protein